MHFALVDNVRTPPSTGLSGTCPVCAREMVAKCGTVRLHHWAHRSRRACDTWWEPETEWHRNWKNHFDPGWQEIIAHDERGEKHIADIRTPRGISIEFQYSHIRPEERVARENFHSNLAWVVSGARLQRDYPRFLKGRPDFLPTSLQGVYSCYFPEEIFPKEWANSSAPVFFDFKEIEPSNQSELNRELLWCLLPGRLSLRAIVLAVTRDNFVRWAKERSILISPQAVFTQLLQAPPPAPAQPRGSRLISTQVLLALQRQQMQLLRRTRRRRF